MLAEDCKILSLFQWWTWWTFSVYKEGSGRRAEQQDDCQIVMIVSEIVMVIVVFFTILSQDIFEMKCCVCRICFCFNFLLISNKSKQNIRSPSPLQNLLKLFSIIRNFIVKFLVITDSAFKIKYWISLKKFWVFKLQINFLAWNFVPLLFF